MSSSSSSPLCWCSDDKPADRHRGPQESVKLEAAGDIARTAQTSLAALGGQVNALTTFQTPAFGHDGNTYHIRVVDIGGEPWFVASDVCSALGMPMSHGAGKNLRFLDSDETKTVFRSSIPDLSGGSFPNRGAICLSESALYKLILRSDKPQAKPFQDWVTRVVLPAIHKDGGYIQGEEKVAKGEAADFCAYLRPPSEVSRIFGSHATR